jgi:xanthine/uracil permease
LACESDGVFNDNARNHFFNVYSAIIGMVAGYLLIVGPARVKFSSVAEGYEAILGFGSLSFYYVSLFYPNRSISSDSSYFVIDYAGSKSIKNTGY